MKTGFRTIFSALLLLFCAFSATAVELVPAAGENGDSAVAIHGIRYLEDVNRSLTADEAMYMLQLADSRSIVTDQFDAGSSHARYWLYFPLRNSADRTGEWRIIASAALRPLLRISLYTTGRQPNVILHTDETQSYSDRDTGFRLMSSKAFSLLPGQSVGILVEYETNGASRLPFYIDTTDGFIDKVHLDDVSSAIVYCFSLTMIFVFLLFGAAARHRVALMYAGLYTIGLLFIAASEGFAFQYLWPHAPAWNSPSPLVLMFAMNAWGFLVAFSTVLEAGVKPRLMKLLLAFAIISVVLMPAPLMMPHAVLYDAGLLLLMLMFIAQAIALTSLAAVSRNHYRIAMIASIVIALLVTVLVMMVFKPALLPELVYMNANRIVYLLAMLATMATITAHINGLRRDHEQAMQNELESSRREAKTSRALFEAEQNYSRVRELASARTRQLADASHDMRQPLFSLRATLDAIASEQPAETRAQLRNAFDYLENICTRSMNASRSAQAPESPQDIADAAADPVSPDSEPEDSTEPYAINLVMDTAVRMFEQEARSRGLELRKCDTSASTDISPLVLMRIITNFLSNAIKHTHAGRILLGARRHDARIRLEVHDTGPGMDETQLAMLQQAYAKGPDSSGEGLGLAICRQQAEQHGLRMQIRSAPGRGTCCSIELPAV